MNLLSRNSAKVHELAGEYYHNETDYRQERDLQMQEQDFFHIVSKPLEEVVSLERWGNSLPVA